MSTRNTQKNQVGTVSDFSLKLKQQKTRTEQKIRVRISKHFRKPNYFTAHFLVFILVFVSLVVSLAYLSNRGENTELLTPEKSLVSEQKIYEKDFTSTGYTIKNPNIILSPYKNSPLTALVIFETETEVSPTITIQGKDQKTTLSHQFVKSKKHFLPVYGLYPDRANQLTISYETSLKNDSSSSDPTPADGINTATNKEQSIPNNEDEGYRVVASVQYHFEIKTDPLPDYLQTATITKSDRNHLNSDLYFFSPATKNNPMVAYDINGDVRWYLKDHISLWNNKKLGNGHLLVSTERLVNPPYYMTGLYEIDLLGKIYAEYSLPGGYHHDYYEMPNSNLLVASNNFDNKNNTVEDLIVELDRKTGQIIKQLDLKKILKTEDGKSENWSNYDWFHNNSIFYDRSSDSLILSGRHQDVIVSLNYQTSTINWLLGDPTNWSEEYQKYFLKPVGDQFEYQWSQHAAKITPEGYLFLFDNGNNKSKSPAHYTPADKSYSRGVLYEINQEDKTVKQIWQYGKERGSEFYSPYISDVDYLGKNHYLVHSGGIVKSDGKPSNQPAGLSSGNIQLESKTVEILNDQPIFELQTNTNNYRVEKMDVYAGLNFSLDSAPKRLGSLGKTASDNVKQGFLTNIEVDQSFLDQHKITLKNEEDRIVVSGFFHREDQVRVALYRNFNTTYYNLKVSKRPYTALCVDIFTEEENQNGILVNRYINKEGLRGNYSIYLEFNGKLYNTGKYVNSN